MLLYWIWQVSQIEFKRMAVNGIQELHIFSATGQEIKVDVNASQVDVSDFENGLYYIVAVADNATYRETFLVAH